MSSALATLAALQRLRRAGERCVAVTVASARGSTPRAAGARMLVTRDAVHETIGGGNLELKAIAIARDLLDGPAPGRALQRFPLGASLGQCCGGAVTLLFDPLFDAPVDATSVPLRTLARADVAAPGADGDWIDTLLRWQRQGDAAIVVTPVRGDAAIRLMVTARETFGFLPHAEAELAAIEIARRMLAGELRADGARLLTLPQQGQHGKTGQPGQPGQQQTAPLLFEPVLRPALRIVLFGAGHVGRALVAALAPIDCEITWVDARPGEFPATVPPQVTVEATDDPESVIDAATAETCFLVMTHSHALDQALAERILRRGDFRYFGLIGSVTKRRSFEQRLGQRGIALAQLRRMTCPIGVRGIQHKEPAAIAIAVAAELLGLPTAAAAAADAADAAHAAAAAAAVQRRSA